MKQRTQRHVRGGFSWILVALAAMALSATPSSAQPVAHDNTLTGNGLNTSPLGVAIPLNLTYKCNTPICYTTPSLLVTNSLGGAIEGTTTASGANAVIGYANNGGTGVYGSGATGVYGSAVSGGNGVYGTTPGSGFGNGVYGSGYNGVYGSGQNNGVYGAGPTGVYGSGSYAGVYGYGQNRGVWADAAYDGEGVYGYIPGNQKPPYYGAGVEGENGGPHGIAVYAHDSSNSNSGTGLYADTESGIGVYSYSALGFALVAGSGDGFFQDNVVVNGNLSKSGGSFKIDHPLDPANKYLYHSFVESPDMMNVYNGNIHTDAAGNATVTLPEWFEALNRDFRYQLTVIGQFAQAIVASKINNNEFTIKTDKPNVEVSWQVTGIRQDAWANAHRIPVEEEKPEPERGFYLHPELHSQSPERGVMWAHYPEIMRAAREKSQARAGR